ncbi:hypothetical protein V7S43_018977 [Phytophthora oleae]|uniref:Uncharacterized protein n=1 Tax=Phytophthora oleae TaxID=2107226 RepID=A0ABD3EP48_9STRA
MATPGSGTVDDPYSNGSEDFAGAIMQQKGILRRRHWSAESTTAARRPEDHDLDRSSPDGSDSEFQYNEEAESESSSDGSTAEPMLTQGNAEVLSLTSRLSLDGTLAHPVRFD